MGLTIDKVIFYMGLTHPRPPNLVTRLLKEAAKKVFFLVAGPLKGGGVNGYASFTLVLNENAWIAKWFRSISIYTLWEIVYFSIKELMQRFVLLFCQGDTFFKAWAYSQGLHPTQEIFFFFFFFLNSKLFESLKVNIKVFMHINVLCI